MNGYVYIGALNGVFYCIDGLTGETIWTFQTEGKILATGAYDSGVITTA